VLKEAADAGVYTSPAGITHPRLQIPTIERLLDGKKLDLPARHDVRTFKKGPKATGRSGRMRNCSSSRTNLTARTCDDE
jgi:hypothetical protein